MTSQDITTIRNTQAKRGVYPDVLGGAGKAVTQNGFGMEENTSFFFIYNICDFCIFLRTKGQSFYWLQDWILAL